MDSVQFLENIRYFWGTYTRDCFIDSYWYTGLPQKIIATIIVVAIFKSKDILAVLATYIFSHERKFAYGTCVNNYDALLHTQRRTFCYFTVKP